MALNQREYCEAHGIPLKAFGNWRAKFKAEPQPPVRKLLYRRRGFSPINFQVRTNEMSDKLLSRDVTAGLFGERTMRRGAHSELNQREYCEAQGIPLKAFGN